MKLLICSDIHGDIACTEAMLRVYEEEKCERLILLGDLLYHGPRNDLPASYAPKAVIEALNARRDDILAVRGNCDTEVDQMVLTFPILADYAYITDGDIRIFATHGHKFNTECPPPLKKGDILLHGHTHVLKNEDFGDGLVYLNPGSVTLPKNGNPRTYMIYENRTFSVYDFDKNLIFSRTF